MTAPSQPQQASPVPDRTGASRMRLWAGLILAVLIAAVYSNTLQVPLIFDDIPSIPNNESIKHLATAFAPQANHGETVEGRPVLNASFALNHALTGNSLPGLHVTNILIHLLAALALWGLVRRTLVLPRFGKRFEATADVIGWIIALLWALHPLQTEAITYTVQRAESLMGLFYLLTLYCFARSQDSSVPLRWQTLCVAACLLGMGTKEVMVSAPLLVLLYDRTFAAGTFRAAWQQRRKLYLGLAGTWLLLAVLVASGGGDRGGSSVNANFCAYALTQSEAVVRYLWLSVWPHPLIFFYGAVWVKHPMDVIPYALIVTALAAGTLFALWRRPVLGFAGAWFFAILAPTSLIPGVFETIVEHRMYLPLAIVLTLIVLGLYQWLGRRTLPVCLALAVGLGWTTVERNHDYRTEISIWADSLAKRPNIPFALNNLGVLYGKTQRLPEAIKLLSSAVALQPNDPSANFNLGCALALSGRDEEAIKSYRAALALEPNNSDFLDSYGAALQRLGRLDEAVVLYQACLRFAPGESDVHHNLGIALLKLGRTEEGLIHLRESVRLVPDDAGYQQSLVRSLAEAGHNDEAIAACEKLVEIKPSADDYTFLGVLYARNHQLPKARDAFQAALRINPTDPEASRNLSKANALLQKAGRQ